MRCQATGWSLFGQGITLHWGKLELSLGNRIQANAGGMYWLWVGTLPVLIDVVLFPETPGVWSWNKFAMQTWQK